MLLRHAKSEDYISIAKLHTQNWKLNYRGILSDYFLDNTLKQFHIETWYNRLKSPPKNQYVSVAVLQDAIIGFACIYVNDDPVFGSLLDNLHISATAQKSGTGKILIKRSAESIIENAADNRMYLWVYENNTNAKAVYDHLGGTNMETINKLNPDGSYAMVCRYAWKDIAVIL